MPILGRNWLKVIKLDWQNIFALTSKPNELLRCLLDEYSETVFRNELGMMTDKAQHLEHLCAVFEQLKQHGLTLKKEKCKFMTDSVTYLGHVIDEKGVHPTQDKTTVSSTPSDVPVFYNTVLEDLPITPNKIRSHTRRDPVLSKVLDFTLKGWPAKESNPVIMPFFRKREEISTEFGCLL
ncbi:hypothetical protein RRG08_042482 [Elysia crispata]|uniref:Reverse transcriptase domain-containing protein n=1 Tax=Elysia crispata TaxID=231223 RepID=A0AAE0YCS8_9GAST|nr:hypothetical protein RRG08_042482 [Elysia crispata]